jgi:hypothetical protein
VQNQDPCIANESFVDMENQSATGLRGYDLPVL